MKIEDMIENEEYKNLVPRSETKQYEQLKKDIHSKGVEEPIVVNSDNVILDGYTRYQIAKELLIKDANVLTRPTQPVEEEKEYIIRKGLLRRHLNAIQRGQIAKKLEKIYKAIGKRNRKAQSVKGKQGFQKTEAPPVDATKQACKEAGTSPQTLASIKKIDRQIEQATPEQKPKAEQVVKDAEKGKISLTSAVKEVKKIINPTADVKTEKKEPPKCVKCGNENCSRRTIVLCMDCFDELQKDNSDIELDDEPEKEDKPKEKPEVFNV